MADFLQFWAREFRIIAMDSMRIHFTHAKAMWMISGLLLERNEILFYCTYTYICFGFVVYLTQRYNE